ncbi:hypothetical protein [Delftia sp. DT-2]|jgi:hypothetical protein|uniref:hypothetical protein n=1 Tax=Delftia sp. DT-2 TaxID=3022772 RepID=UPI00233E87A3|nr:hypothetical protein [Delftia sp. DT-2]MDC2862250.1 hypothetical protein [Delftia sp. DT-2]MDR3016998.1 hypothetical protein [Delftia acidovorans]
MRSSVNAALESNATRSISSGLVNRLGWWSSFWPDIYPFGDAHLLPAGVGFAAIAATHACILSFDHSRIVVIQSPKPPAPRYRGA